MPSPQRRRIREPTDNFERSVKRSKFFFLFSGTGLGRLKILLIVLSIFQKIPLVLAVLMFNEVRRVEGYIF